MDDVESTQAAELELTAPAPSQDETQSIHAWADDDDDTEIVRHRSWKIPVSVAVLAAASAITAGVVMAWPQHHIVAAQPPAAAQPVPVLVPDRPLKTVDQPPPLTPDQQFLAALNQEGLKPIGDPTVAIKAAHETCDYLAAGHTRTQAVQHYAANNPELTPTQLATAIEITAQTYCP